MNTVSYDVQYTESRNRLTTFFRGILSIPHMIVAGVWGYLAQLLAVIQWFIVLFTGKRNEGMWNMQNQWNGYSARVSAYYSLMYDPYPPFGNEVGNTGVSYSLAFEAEANRLTCGLRLLWAIPAMIIGIGVGIAGFVVTVASWFAILFTGKHPKGMFDFLVKVQRFTVMLTAYTLLMTDTYPKYG